jgi:diguanylate cyclase (GGDEF)-like protein
MSIHSGKLISSIEQISSLLILEGEGINTAMEMLSLAGSSLSADCLYIYRTGHIEKGQKNYFLLAEWTSPALSEMRSNSRKTYESMEEDSATLSRLEKGETVFNQSGSRVSIPVMKDRFRGVICCEDYSENRTWSDDEIAFLRIVGHSVASLFTVRSLISAKDSTNLQQLKKTEYQLVVRDSVMAMINEICMLSLKARTLEEAAGIIIVKISERPGVYRCRLSISRKISDDIDISSGESLDSPSGDGQIEDQVVEVGGPGYLLSRYLKDTAAYRRLCISMELDSDSTGTLEVIFDGSGELDGSVSYLFGLAGNFLKLVLNRVKYLSEIERARKVSQSLRRATEIITKSLRMEKTIKVIVEELSKVIPFYSASLELLNGDELVIVGGKWPDQMDFTGRHFTIEEGSPGYDVLYRSEAILSKQAQKDYPQFDIPDFHFIKSWMGVPLIIKEKPIGIIAVDSNRENAFDNLHIEALRAFADIASIGINNSRLHEEVEQQAIRDYLTGIYNRRGLFELGERELKKAQRYQTDTGLIMFDIDNFKKLNDRHGHLAGDFVLKAATKICGAELRSADIFARYGGDEFVVILPMTDLAKTREVAKRLCNALCSYAVEYNETMFNIRASFGVTSYRHDDTLEEMIKRADGSLYISKNAGGNRVSGGEIND